MPELRPHQTKAVEEMHNGCILDGGVGTGKTITAIWYYVTKVCEGHPHTPTEPYQPMKKPRDVVVITTARKRDDQDWQDEFARFGLTVDDSTGWHEGSGNSILPEQSIRIRVDSWNNITKYKDYRDAFFIFDEQRLVGYGAWVKAFLKIAKANQWVLLSATPGDSWADYIPVFIANGYYRNKTEFLENHAVWDRYSKFPKVAKFVGTGRLNRYRRNLLVHMPYERSTQRFLHYRVCSYDQSLFKKVVRDQWDPFSECPIENVSQRNYLMRKVVNSDPSRSEILCSIMSKNSRVIIFYNFDYEREILLKILDSFQSSTNSSANGELTVAEWNGHKHEPVPATERWAYLVQYTAGNEAWNCVTTDTMVFWSLNYSYRVFEQCQGRIDRLNTPFKELHYYIFYSKSAIDLAIRRALKEKRTFNESRDLGKIAA